LGVFFMGRNVCVVCELSRAPWVASCGFVAFVAAVEEEGEEKN